MDIIINGVSIQELKRQQQAIRQDASKFISEGVEKAKKLVSAITETEDATEQDKLAAEALELLEAVETVSNATGVEYYIPNRGNNCYDSRDEVMTCILEETFGEENDRLYSGAIGALASQLEDMEYSTDRWNTSYC